ncbi:hypothetical protein VHEMI09051 [[Torrubiella] hemipterigena]|uniref:2EXR domain-containing protein n=1 Tax=[Torrubiella] hemipterigena TaxID=1531966 RepID=A0A0A1TPB3_9HYPO|nr:hypothetical protein VHEMI09051 [[Torrubiella] hemipterigena]
MPPTDFNTLPSEIRQAIWQFTIQDDEPEVCLCWPTMPSGFLDSLADSVPQLPLTVDTAFPVAMHICRESRAVMQSPRSGIRFRASEVAGCRVPFRLYRADLDALYLSAQWMHLFLLDMHLAHIWTAGRTDPDVEALKTWYAVLLSAGWIAIDGRHGVYYTDDILRLRRASRRPPKDGDMYPDVTRRKKRLSYVVPSSRYNEDDLDHELKFKEPGRRCKLVTLSQEAQNAVRVYTQQSESCNLPSPLSHAIKLLANGILGWDQDFESPIFTGDSKILPQTFVEYQPDGTWSEVCQDRLFKERPDTPVSVQDRPDPETVRVMDAEIDFPQRRMLDLRLPRRS